MSDDPTTLIRSAAKHLAESGRIKTHEGETVWLDWYQEPYWILNALTVAECRALAEIKEDQATRETVGTIRLSFRGGPLDGQSRDIPGNARLTEDYLHVEVDTATYGPIAEAPTFPAHHLYRREGPWHAWGAFYRYVGEHT